MSEAIILRDRGGMGSLLNQTNELLNRLNQGAVGPNPPAPDKSYTYVRISPFDPQDYGMIVDEEVKEDIGFLLYKDWDENAENAIIPRPENEGGYPTRMGDWMRQQFKAGTLYTDISRWNNIDPDEDDVEDGFEFLGEAFRTEQELIDAGFADGTYRVFEQIVDPFVWFAVYERGDDVQILNRTDWVLRIDPVVEEGGDVVGQVFVDLRALVLSGFGDPPGNYLVYKEKADAERYMAVYDAGPDTMRITDTEWETFFVPNPRDNTEAQIAQTTQELVGTYYSTQRAMREDGITSNHVIYRKGNRYFVVDENGAGTLIPDEEWNIWVLS